MAIAQGQAGQGQRFGGRGEEDLAARWRPEDLDKAIHRLAEAERSSRLSHGVGETVLAQELINVARLGARGR